MSITPETQQFFIENGIVGVHYGGDILPGKNRCSINPDDYNAKARRVLNRMRWYSEKGAIVVGYFNEHSPNRMIIGLLPSGSSLRPIVRDLPGDGRYPDGRVCYKTIQLENFFEVDLALNRQFESCIPRGNVFVNWRINEVDRSIKYLYKLHNGLVSQQDRTVYDLSYTQLEVLCSEYLREVDEPHKIKHFINPIGRTQKATDIDGVNEDGYILAQVSFASDDNEIKSKMLSLFLYLNPQSKLLYFGPESKKHLAVKDIEYVSIEEVYRKMKGSLLLKHI